MKQSSVKQVPSQVYDKAFFDKVYGEDNDITNFDTSLSKEYYSEMVNILKPSSTDFLVDYGCGNGTLSFLLWKRYKTKVLGLDYSKDAINICLNRLRKFKSASNSKDITFKVANNNSLPRLHGVTHVYFCDVIEHMYDPEIRMAISEIKTWNKQPIIMVFHTDNNIYLNLVRPILNLFFLIAGKKNFSDLRREASEEKLVHVNLTNFISLRRQMESMGLNHVTTKFPLITKSKVKKQLGALAKYQSILDLTYRILKLFPFFSPSFFSVFTTSNQ